MWTLAIRLSFEAMAIARRTSCSHFGVSEYSTFLSLVEYSCRSIQHKSADVQRWLKPKRRRRFHFHFTPTSSSWLNQVERWFGLITDKMIRRGTFHSVEELERAIYAWLASWNDKPKAFVWKATADVILDKVRRCKELSGTAHQFGCCANAEIERNKTNDLMAATVKAPTLS